MWRRVAMRKRLCDFLLTRFDGAVYYGDVFFQLTRSKSTLENIKVKNGVASGPVAKALPLNYNYTAFDIDDARKLCCDQLDYSTKRSRLEQCNTILSQNTNATTSAFAFRPVSENSGGRLPSIILLLRLSSLCSPISPFPPPSAHYFLSQISYSSPACLRRTGTSCGIAVPLGDGTDLGLCVSHARLPQSAKKNIYIFIS
ncbi:hypothetical protein EVAR_78847_1 [Eumeta japonica]|uniref:Uncharacterized protein n=1 Tax=Eumeta variegata TaxID=151549 RepID=A0A4C1U2D6_EUMVA|nr:hypothetical protein EVAR_78847_1 [Eumeta japonica]